MTPSARVQAAIDILDLVIAEAVRGGAPADRVIVEWFRTRRFAGSGDRRALRELVFRAIRACGPVPASGRAAMLRLVAQDASLGALFNGGPHAPAPIAPDEAVADAGVAPEWLAAALADSGIAGEDALALLGRAPLDIRVNTLKADPATLALPVPAEAVFGEALPETLRLPAGTSVESWDAFADGLIEVQDAGSQWVGHVAAAMPGETIVDLCAGAGGKTLALAAHMQNRGRLIACDASRDRLARLAPRAMRAGAIVETRLLDGGREITGLRDLVSAVDAVLVDAPCSGTGTWRRNPEARWRLNPGELVKLTQLQARLIDIAAGLVKPGGRLVYVTCSLLDAEGAAQIDQFLARAGEAWHAEPITPTVLPATGATLGQTRGKGLRLAPLCDETDGFFVAVAKRLW